MRGLKKRVRSEKTEAIKERRTVEMPVFLRATAEEIVSEAGNEEDYGWPIMIMTAAES